MGKFTNKTTDGAKRLFALLAVLILLFSGFAHVLATNFGRVKIEQINIDARGALLDGELYYPVGTTDEDSLPAVIVTHGAGCTHKGMNSYAMELARRGFVVFAVSANGSGISEFPQRDEIGAGEQDYDARNTPGGLHDALGFVRTLKFVDQTRIGMMGHSQGSRRTSYAASIDVGYYTLNDILINVLYEEFGQKFTESEITQDASTLAEQRLNEDQLAHFNTIKAEKTEHFNTRLKAALIVGGDAPQVSPMQTVTVGGFEVRRNAQVNLGLIIGDYDSYIGYPAAETTLEAWHSAETVADETWYSIDDITASHEQLGGYTEISITDNEQLRQAVEGRCARVVCFNPEMHATNQISVRSVSDALKFFEQTLAYNNGELLAGDAQPISTANTIFFGREVLNGLAMICMVLMLVPLAVMMMQLKPFARESATGDVVQVSFDKKKYWVFGVLMVALSFVAILVTNRIFNPFMPYFEVLPLFFNWWVIFMYLGFMGLLAVVLLAVFYWQDKKAGRKVSFGLKVPGKTVVRALLLAVCLIAAAYVSLGVIRYLFGEDFRFWNNVFGAMKVEYWWLALKFALVIFLPQLAINVLTNYTVRSDIPEWKDTLFTVLFSTAGVWLCCMVNVIVLHTGGTAICNWNSAFALPLMLPLTTYLSRKLYKLTGNVWLGTVLITLLVSWGTVSSMGYNTYIEQSVWSNFFYI